MFDPDISFHITARCNCTCFFCGLKEHGTPKIQGKQEMTPEEIGTFLKDAKIKARAFGVTGGEPVIRDDLPEIIRLIKKYVKYEVLSLNTNATMTEKVVALKKEFPEMRLATSVDGLEENHDRIRGKGMFQKTMKTIELANIKDVRFVVTPQNYMDLKEVYLLSEKLGLALGITRVEPIDMYPFTEDQLREANKQVDWIANDMREKLSLDDPQFRFKTLLYLEMTMGTIYHRTGKRPIPCAALKGLLLVDPYGDVYPCPSKPWGPEYPYYGSTEFLLGNVKERSWPEIMGRRPEMLRKLKPLQCNGCWNICSLKSLLIPFLSEWQ